MRIEEKIKKIGLKDLNVISVLKLFNIFIKLDKEECLKYMKVFVRENCSLEEDMPDDFYELIINKINNKKYLSLFYILSERDIYLLISYLKYNNEDVSMLKEIITPVQYYSTSKKCINHIIEKLMGLEKKNDNGILSDKIKDELLWNLKKTPHYQMDEYINIAYKIYLSIGQFNGVELLDGKYGKIDYEKIYFLFLNLEVNNKLNLEYQDTFCKFIFENKRDYNNIIRQMLRGDFCELFLNFDYFYNNFNYFVDRLGIKMLKDRVCVLLKDRFLTHSPECPKITGDVVIDMISSYYCKYEYRDVTENEIYSKNIDIYNKYLRNKYKSSIPEINIFSNGKFKCEVLSLSDPRNLVLGYRSGNCFRINGDASTLFHNFLKSEHMRLVSISTMDNKDYAMMLVMRNGNVLIGQGIEVSKRVPSNIKGKELYDTCRLVLKEMMDYMNDNGDLIVATIIGSSNENVSLYNNQRLLFLVNPILDSNGNYYNGIYNYQCLLDLCEGKSLSDIKLYIPTVRYLDKRENILRRYNRIYSDNYSKIDDNYRKIEERLRALRYLRSQKEGSFEFYNTLFNHSEIYTCCNKDWYITLFDDGTIDGFVVDDDERAMEEYNIEMEKIRDSILGSKKKTRYMRCKRKN